MFYQKVNNLMPSLPPLPQGEGEKDKALFYLSPHPNLLPMGEGIASITE